LPQSTKGVKVMTVPAAAINFRKSRRDTFPPVAGGVCAIPNENDYLIINKPLENYSGLPWKNAIWHNIISQARASSQEWIIYV
jgi:hypothetical protein